LAFTGRSAACAPATATSPAAEPDAVLTYGSKVKLFGNSRRFKDLEIVDRA
jgi:hypothetical protein